MQTFIIILDTERQVHHMWQRSMLVVVLAMLSVAIVGCGGSNYVSWKDPITGETYRVHKDATSTMTEITALRTRANGGVRPSDYQILGTYERASKKDLKITKKSAKKSLKQQQYEIRKGAGAMPIPTPSFQREMQARPPRQPRRY